jgi:hypothetical protein
MRAENGLYGAGSVCTLYKRKNFNVRRKRSFKMGKRVCFGVCVCFYYAMFSLQNFALSFYCVRCLFLCDCVLPSDSMLIFMTAMLHSV